MRILFLITLTMTLLNISIDPIDPIEPSIHPLVHETYITESMAVCNSSSVKSYMPYTAITNKQSRQYKFIQENLDINQETGLLEDSDGFIAVAMGSYFQEIGTRYLITLDTGITLKLVKAEQKSDSDTANGCSHESDGSVIEFLVDKKIASTYYGTANNGLILSGNFNNNEDFKGRIIEISEVIDEQKRSMGSLIEKPAQLLIENLSIN